MQINILVIAVLSSGIATQVLAADNAPPTKQELEWRLPKVPAPSDNATTPERVALGKALFFDPRLSGDGMQAARAATTPR